MDYDNRTEDYHQNGYENHPTYDYLPRDQALDETDVEPMPSRTTGHLWGSDAEFSPDGIRSARAPTVTQRTYKLRSKLLLIEGDEALVKGRIRSSC